MKIDNTPLARSLVFVGGGHSHALALRGWGMKPQKGVQTTLISDQSSAPYSGMLPGLIDGSYSFEETHIDLRKLCNFAQAQFVRARVKGIDLEKKQILMENHPPIRYDICSINIGSTPTIKMLSGAKENATPVKPVPKLLTTLTKLTEKIKETDKVLEFSVIGGGAAGVELAIALKKKFKQHCNIQLFHDDDELLPTHAPKVRKLLTQRAIQLEIKIFNKTRIERIEAKKLFTISGESYSFDECFCATQASAPSWLKESGLSVDKDGFIEVRQTLQSYSHPEVFAAGDIASMKEYPRPKSGVFAVRQAKPLLKNLRRYLLGKPCKDYIPQKRFLSLVGTSNQSAVASKGNFAFSSPLLWKWKEHIDRKFMLRFSDLPQMGEKEQKRLSKKKGGTDFKSQLALLQARSLMRCHGCAAKVGSSVLQRVMERLRSENKLPKQSSDILIGLKQPDDAAAFLVPAGKALVQTIDYFPALVKDPFLFGQITVYHCLSDIFAMGAEAHSVQALALLPFAEEALVEESLYQLLSGILYALKPSGTVLLGGHTAEANDLALGLVCNGLIDPEKLMRKSGMQTGDQLILTKALGTGTLFAADMRLATKTQWIEQALNSMLQSNQKASQIVFQHAATACTDVTGFGLLGHAHEMLKASQKVAAFKLSQIPTLLGAIETSSQGILSSLAPQNQRIAQFIENPRDFLQDPTYPLLFDPQTSGGLLASIPKENVALCIQELHEAGYQQASVIGQVEEEFSESTEIQYRFKLLA